jgi:two-component system sporulation sensor kinase A
MLIQSEKLASLGRFVSEVAHEINNPLTVISGNAELSLMSGPVNAEVKNNLQIIMKECREAKSIIERLLKFSKPSKGEIKKVDINKSLEALAGILEEQFKPANIEIRREYGDNLALIPIDEQLMQEVFANLINNAKDAMPKGGAVTIKTSLDEDCLRIDIKDAGSGMPEEAKRRLFEPFFSTKEKGTGLGLAICYSIVKAHHGELRFESRLNMGTTATVLLPLKRMPA